MGLKFSDVIQDNLQIANVPSKDYVSEKIIEKIEYPISIDNPMDQTDLGVVVDNGANAYYPSVFFDINAFETDSAYRFKCYYSVGTSLRVINSMDGTTQTTPVSLTGLQTAHHPCVLYSRSGFGIPGSIKQKLYYQNSTVSNLLISTMRYAESVDGTTQINDQAITQDATLKLITGNSGDWNAGTWGFQKVFYNQNKDNTGTDPFNYSYCAYYDCNTGTTYQCTGIAYSSDGINQYRGSNTPVLLRSSSDATAQDFYTASFGTFLIDVNGFHCQYSGGRSEGGFTDNFGIGYAFSEDGITQTKDVNNPIFTVLDGLTYRDERCYTPNIVNDNAGTLYMIYTATGSAQTGRKKLALATLKYQSIKGILNSSNIKNDSSVSGDTITDALNTLLSLVS